MDFVKTGKGKELAPLDNDWLYIRTGIFLLIIIFLIKKLPWLEKYI